MADKNFKIKTGLDLPAPLPVDQGGTGQTSTTNSLNALLPVQADNAGKYLTTNGTTTSWGTVNTSAPTIVYSVKTDNYEFVSGDENNIFAMNAATQKDFRIPTDATFNFAIGTQFHVLWIGGAGQPEIVATTPGTTTIISTAITSTAPFLRIVNSMATCLKLSANTWIVVGDIY
jgi:hypothetical protein